MALPLDAAKPYGMCTSSSPTRMRKAGELRLITSLNKLARMMARQADAVLADVAARSVASRQLLAAELQGGFFEFLCTLR